MKIEDNIQFHEFVIAEVKEPLESGTKKLIQEFRIGVSLYKKDNVWNHLYRYIDWKRDLYDKIITDKNGKIIHECHEPLSKHTGHGSAKYKKN